MKTINKYIDDSKAVSEIRDLQKQLNKYRLLFEQMTEGYALHEIICNEKGSPVDYKFIEVNSAFENLTGLKKEKIIGKTVKEVLPGIEEYWIERYGQVVLTGKPAEFEEYSKGLNKYFKVKAYRPEIGKFVVIFEDITGRKKTRKS
ncbi:MAG: PAS domain S-box protein [Ignavibacteria bacterium]|jgi:PAS domain S-box-containing protein